MSVHVLYKGRLGNHLFQYVCARLFARRNGLRLATPFTHQEFVRMEPHDPGDWVERSEFNSWIRDGDDPLGRRWPRARYVFDGYFQDSSWYHSARGDIESFARPCDVEPAGPEDIVVSLRVGKDYRDFGWVIRPDWYLGILDRERFRRLHVVTDVRDEAYLSHFRKYDPVVTCSGAAGDWRTLRSFSRIVCSNSTFAWWAAYFSRASMVYTFKGWVGRPEVRLGAFPNGLEVEGCFLDGRRPAA